MRSGLPIVFLTLLAAPGAAAAPYPDVARPPSHEITVSDRWFTMADGVRLAATVWRPVPRRAGERFPALLELLPYRKDDSFARRDWRHHAYFARRGYISARVDVRGTGGSEGRLPDREYSEAELADAEALIDQLAREPGACGRVGMWGISWGGFNAIQTAMRAPPALGAILAVDASDDLYHDDVRYLDGVFHVDAYVLEIDHENALPRSPAYEVDGAYLTERFLARPWLLRYLEQQQDGPFWAAGSLRGQYERLRVPSFLIGGLQDYYRDSIPRMLENVRAPVAAWIGPWNHDFPDSGTPGPNHDWREAALAWWDHWLGGVDRGADRWGRLAVYVRDGHPPGDEVTTAPGRWRTMAWPDPRQPVRRWLTGAPGRLSDRAEPRARVPLPYRPGSGRAALEWWGDTPGDMREDDAGAACFDTAPLAKPVLVVGRPVVRLVYRPRARLVHVAARLEDVAPDGRVTLVTGAGHNGAQRAGGAAPARPGTLATTVLPLHFTTWTFQPGHRIRLALSHAQFPMMWPTPEPTTSLLLTGARGTDLELPLAPRAWGPSPVFPAPQPLEERPDSEALPGGRFSVRSHGIDARTGRAFFRIASDYRYRVDGRGYHVVESLRHETDPARPASSSVEGRATTRIDGIARPLELDTVMRVESDAEDFHVEVRRTLTSRGRTLAQRTWRERVPRDGQ